MWVMPFGEGFLVITSSRFGKVEINEKDTIFFPEGLLGFADLRKFVLLDDPEDDIFAWLQSCEVAEVAFPVLEPELFSGNYNFKLTKRDMEALDLEKDQRYRVYTIVTIPDDPTQMTANLKAPVIINVPDRKARQCVLQDNDLPIRHSIFTDLQKRVVAQPNVSIKETSIDKDLSVSLTMAEAKV